MTAVGFPISSVRRRVVCVGHSAGGQLCRHYATYWGTIKGAILLDSMVINRWAVAIAKNMSTDTMAAY